MKKVSVIIPVYMVEDYLDRCVESVVNQTLKEIEIILVDDGGKDRCAQICEDWAKRDERVKVIHKQNQGLGMACNTGIEAATGKYVAFVDSDDWVEEDYLETVFNHAEDCKADAVYSGIRRVDEHGNKKTMSVAGKNGYFKGQEIVDFALEMIADPVNSPYERRRQMSSKIVLYSNEIVKRENIRFKSEREYVSEDLLFNLDFLTNCTCVAEIAQIFYNYFFNTTSLSNTLGKGRFEKYKNLRGYLIDRYGDSLPREKLRERVDKMFIGYVRALLVKIVSSSIGYRQKYNMVATICSDKIWDEIAKEFPIKELPKKKRMVFNMIRHRQVLLLLFVFKLKK